MRAPKSRGAPKVGGAKRVAPSRDERGRFLPASRRSQTDPSQTEDDVERQGIQVERVAQTVQFTSEELQRSIGAEIGQFRDRQDRVNLDVTRQLTKIGKDVVDIKKFLAAQGAGGGGLLGAGLLGGGALFGGGLFTGKAAASAAGGAARIGFGSSFALGAGAAAGAYELHRKFNERILGAPTLGSAYESHAESGGDRKKYEESILKKSRDAAKPGTITAGVEAIANFFGKSILGNDQVGKKLVDGVGQKVVEEVKKKPNNIVSALTGVESSKTLSNAIRGALFKNDVEANKFKDETQYIISKEVSQVLGFIGAKLFPEAFGIKKGQPGGGVGGASGGGNIGPLPEWAKGLTSPSAVPPGFGGGSRFGGPAPSAGWRRTSPGGGGGSGSGGDRTYDANPKGTGLSSWADAPISQRRVDEIDKNPNIAGIIESEAASAGVDPKVAKAIAHIESSGNPNNRTGSYQGLYQLDDDEMRKYNPGGNVWDPRDNSRAAFASMKEKAAAFEKKFGRPPTPTEFYLGHQQGQGGLSAHLKNPGAPAWQNMWSTGEGQTKGPEWAKRAVWGNVPTDMRHLFPEGVEGMTSAQFGAVWAHKMQGIPYEDALKLSQKGTFGAFGSEPKRDGSSGATNAPQSGGKFSIDAGTRKNGVENIHPELLDVIRETAKHSKYDVNVISGYRPGDPRRHGQGLATDIELIDPKTGKALPNYQDPKAFRTYEEFAQRARSIQMEKYPHLKDQFKWGGYFSGPIGKNGVYGAVDLMHFDLGGQAAGGTWEGGLTPQQRQLIPGAESVGMGPSLAEWRKRNPTMADEAKRLGESKPSYAGNPFGAKPRPSWIPQKGEPKVGSPASFLKSRFIPGTDLYTTDSRDVAMQALNAENMDKIEKGASDSRDFRYGNGNNTVANAAAGRSSVNRKSVIFGVPKTGGGFGADGAPTTGGGFGAENETVVPKNQVPVNEGYRSFPFTSAPKEDVARALASLREMGRAQSNSQQDPEVKAAIKGIVDVTAKLAKTAEVAEKSTRATVERETKPEQGTAKTTAAESKTDQTGGKGNRDPGWRVPTPKPAQEDVDRAFNGRTRDESSRGGTTSNKDDYYMYGSG